MDDFGSDYSSLNVLKDYHFDVIKIDMGFLFSPPVPLADLYKKMAPYLLSKENR